MKLWSHPSLHNALVIVKGDFNQVKISKTQALFTQTGCIIAFICGTLLFILLDEGPGLLSDCQTNAPLLHAAGLSIHTGLVRQCCASDTNSGSASEAQRNFTPSCIQNFHTEEDA